MKRENLKKKFHGFVFAPICFLYVKNPLFALHKNVVFMFTMVFYGSFYCYSLRLSFKLLPDTILNFMLLLTGINIIKKQFVDSVFIRKDLLNQ